MFCSKCGTNNTDGAKFCSGCGAPMMDVEKTVYAPVEPAPVQPQAPVYAPVEPAPVQPQAPVYAPVEPIPVQPQAPVYAPVEPTPVQPQDYGYVAPAPQKPKKNNTGLIVGIIVGVLVLIGAVIAILFATGVFETDSNSDDTKTEETEKKNQDKNENDNADEEETEAQKGDETHDGRLIGTWTGYETTEMEGYEVELKMTYTFKEDGTYESSYDYDQYAQVLEDVVVKMLYDEYGLSRTEGDELFEEAYGMNIDEYANYTVEEIRKQQKDVEVSWESDGSQLKSTAKTGDSSTEVSSTLNYSFSNDGNTLYLTGTVYGASVSGEYTRVK